MKSVPGSFLRAAAIPVVIGLLAASNAGVLAAPLRVATTISGAGSTFVAPVLTGQWVPGYTGLHSNVQIAYDGIGSGAGISLLIKGNIDFAGSDALLTTAQEKQLGAQCGGSVVKIPVTIGAVALIYNLPGVKTGLKLTPDVVANIFLGKIASWNDPQIARLNRGITLPSIAIQTVHRADGSGTSYIFTNYLSVVSPAWKSKVGAGASVAWPTGTGAPKSSGVAAAVVRTPGAVSYVDLAYATSNGITYASVRNAKGNYTAPGVASASVAADSFAAAMPKDLQQLIVNSLAPTAYPITGYSYIFLCARQPRTHGQTLVDFVTYVVTTGQKSVQSLSYAPLPPSVRKLDVAALHAVTIH